MKGAEALWACRNERAPLAEQLTLVLKICDQSSISIAKLGWAREVGWTEASSECSSGSICACRTIAQQRKTSLQCSLAIEWGQKAEEMGLTRGACEGIALM